MRRECEPALHEDDPETALRALNEKRLALSFRIALAALDGRQSARDSMRQLAWLAEEVVRVVLRMVHAEVVAAHGEVAGGRFAVIGYGSLGGEELGFGSDLDLVFLFDADAAATSSGARSLEAGRWYARLAQKLVALLGAATGAGRLYDVDVRLRPDGAKGLLVSSVSSYRDYQLERAWTWEHQALVRARGVAGDASLLGEFDAIRAQTLSQSRETQKLQEEVGSMRLKMRAELDRSDAARFDLKQGAGGLVDLEFLLQYLVLRDSPSHAALLEPRDTQGLIDALRAAGTLDETQSQSLLRVHDYFVGEGLSCTLDRRPRLLPESEAILAARAVVQTAVSRNGLEFCLSTPDK
jgi:glutamate-ammonia-ligase adenylyltransferase